MGFFSRIFGFQESKKRWNRRRYPRKKTHNLVAIDSPDRHIFNLADVSEGGLQFYATARPKSGQMFPCTLNFAEMGTQVSVLAQVVWSQRVDPTLRSRQLYRVGLSFLGASQESIQVIRDFIQLPPLGAAA